MQNEYFEQMTKMSKDAFASFKDLADINARAAEKLIAKQTEIVNNSIESSVSQMKALTSAKDYKAFFSTQAELTKENSELVMSYGKEVAKIMDEAKDELTAWMESSVAKAEGAVSSASKAVKKAA